MTAPIAGYFTLMGTRAGGSVPNPAVQGSTLDRWYSDFKGPDGTEYKDCYWLRQPGKEPTVGDAFYGEMESGERGYRFRSKTAPPEGAPPANVAAQGGGAPPRAAGQGSQGDRQHRIERQHSQSAAVELIKATGYAKDLNLDQPEVVSAFLNGPVRKITDFFQLDISRNPKDDAPQQAAASSGDDGDDGDVPF